MQYAKVNSDVVIKFPYTIRDMEQDNPELVVVKCEDFPTFYSSTEDAKNGSSVVLVKMESFPAIDSLTQKAVLKDTPSLVDGEWSLGFDVLQMTEEEIAVAQGMKVDGTIQ